MFDIIVPLFSITIVFVAVVVFIWRKLKQNLFVELGVIYLAFVVLYTLAPGFGLLYAEYSSDLKVGLLLDFLDADKKDLAFHLWRHFLFAITFAGSYFLFRKNKKIVSINLKEKSATIVYLLILILTIFLLTLFFLSAPVNGYLDHYTRYNHLPTGLRKLVSFIIRFKMGFYTILLTLLFSQYKRFKWLINFVVASIFVFLKLFILMDPEYIV